MGNLVSDLADEACSYGDGCPVFGSRHGACIYCKARRELEYVRTLPVASFWFHKITNALPTFTCTQPEAPIAKERPRVYHGRRGVRTMTPERTKAAEDYLAMRLRLEMKGRAPFEGNLALVCVFYRPDRRRIDGDNMLKLVCDAGNLAPVWLDDSQCTTKLARIELDKDNPRTEIALGPFASTLER